MIVPLRYPANALVSYHYFATTDIGELRRGGLRLIADSGAFSASNIGAPIALDSFGTWGKKWINDVAWLASLDSIGDPQGSWDNFRVLRDEFDLPVVPTLHYGTTPDHMDRYVAEGVDLLGLGGMIPYKGEPKRLLRWCAGMFRYARDHHPTVQFHGWGVTHRLLVLNLPWYSVDSSGFGSSYRYGRLPLFDPATGWFRTVAMDGVDAFNHGRLLREVYGVEPSAVAESTAETRANLVRAGVKGYQMLEDRLRERFPPRQSPTYVTAGPSGNVHAADTGLDVQRMMTRRQQQ